MTIKIRNKRICTKRMNLVNLTRLSNAVEWELTKELTTPKKQMLQFISLILNNRINRMINRETRKAVC